jgi:phenylalanyl-tRNA synthetase beta chain
MKRILKGLGFDLKAANDSALEYKIPSWRVDVEQEEDLVEEVARHFGYEKIVSELPPSPLR